MISARFVVGKLVGAVITLFIAVTIAFIISRLAGDPAVQLVGNLATPEQIAAKRAELGLDRSLLAQYLDFMRGLLSGDLGQSLRFRRSNWELISDRLWPSAQLTIAAVGLGTSVGVVLGVFAASHEGRIGDRVSSMFALLGQSVPVFWLGLILVLFFAIRLGWFPAGQSGTWRHLVLPAVALSTIPMARVARLVRSSMVEVMEESYITAARARGYSDRRVLYVHALRNAALPVITLVGLQAGTLLSGAVTIEFVFAWPGLGTLATQAVEFRDFPLVQALVVFGALAFVLINLATDLTYGLIDPRLREPS